MAVIITVYMKKRDRSFRIFGFKSLDIRKEKVTLYYIPLLIIAIVQPIMGGFNLELTATEIILILIFSFSCRLYGGIHFQRDHQREIAV